MQVYTSLVMEFKIFFANRLKEARAKRGLSQGQLARLCGLHKTAIGRYETHVIIPTVETLKKLAQALEVSADYFVFDGAKMEGVPKIQDPEILEKCSLLEDLGEDDRKSVLNIMDALIERHQIHSITKKRGNASKATDTPEDDPQTATA